jgi:hypothetical protein
VEVGGVDSRGANWSATTGGLGASIVVLARRVDDRESGGDKIGGGSAEARRRGAEIFFTPT